MDAQDLYWVRQLSPQLSDGKSRDLYVALGKYGELVVHAKPPEPVNANQAIIIRNMANAKVGRGVYIERAYRPNS